MGIRRSALALGLSAAALIVSVQSGWAGDTSAPASQQTETAAPAQSLQSVLGDLNFSIKVGDINAVDSSIDAETLKAIFSGDYASHAEQLKNWNAKSVIIPSLEVSYDMASAVNGAAKHVTVTYHDFDLRDISGGVVDTMSVGGWDMAEEGVHFTTGKFSAKAVDIGRSLALYGLVKAPEDGAVHTLYKDARLDGGKVTFGSGSCDIGPISIGEFKMRGTGFSFQDFMSTANQMNADTASGKKPRPEDVSKLFGYLGDMASTFESSDISLDGVTCSGTDSSTGGKADIKVGKTIIGAYKGDAHYPQITSNDLSIDAQDGHFSLARITVKGIDYAPALKTLASAKGQMDDAWFTAHAREMMPTFDGFALDGLDVDIPDPESPGDRIKLSLASFDVSLAQYINAIPTKVSSFAKHLVFDIPKQSSDPNLMMLRSMGISTLDLGYQLAMHWDQASQTIAADKVSVEGKDLGSASIAMMIGNAVPELFGLDSKASDAAAANMTIKSVNVDLANDGILKLVYELMAKEQNADAQSMQSMFSGMAKGMILAIFSSNPDAINLATAAEQFFGGNARTLSATFTAKDPAGIGMATLQGAQEDPKVLASAIDIKATAE